MHLLLHLPAATPSTEGPAFGPGRGSPKLGAGGATESQGSRPHCRALPVTSARLSCHPTGGTEKGVGPGP